MADPEPSERLRFCAAHPVGSFTPGVRQLIVEVLGRTPEHVWDRRDGQEVGARMVATLIDTTDNVADSAELTIVGLSGSDEARLRLFEAALPWGEALARQGPKRAYDVSVWPQIVAFERVLAREGFEVAYGGYEMLLEAPASAPGPEPPEGFEWRELREGEADLLRGMLERAFEGAPDFHLTSPEVFRQRMAVRRPRPRLLWAGDEAVACLTVSAPEGEDGEGHVNTIGREPAWRGRGLGPLALAEAIRVLRAHGATRVTLGVAATNERALDLYRGFGFRQISVDRVWRRPL